MKRTLIAIAIVGMVVVVARIGPAAGTGPAGGKPGEPGGKAQADELRAEIKRLQALVPDQAAVMTHVGYHWGNLWFALEQQNWPLADFYLGETRANLKWAVRARPFRDTAAGKIDLGAIAEALDNSQLKEMKEAIAGRDKKRCVKLYDQVIEGCYACHKASEKPYLRPHRPAAPEARIINFDPNAKDP